jgi:hypothetical protein
MRPEAGQTAHAATYIVPRSGPAIKWYNYQIVSFIPPVSMVLPENYFSGNVNLVTLRRVR